MMKFQEMLLKYDCHCRGAINLWFEPTCQTGTTVPAKPAVLAQTCNAEIISC